MGPRILIVDDKQFIIQLLSEFLLTMKLQSEHASHGQKALDILQHRSFDLIITDIHMPHLDGIELTCHVKKHWPEIDVLCMTGSFEKETATKAIRAGAIDFMQKPISFEEFQAKIERILRERANLKNLQAKVDETERLKDKVLLQNRFLDHILNALTHPFYVVDPKSYQIVLGNKFCGLSARHEKNLCYRLIYGRDSPCDPDGQPCPIVEVLKNKTPLSVEHVHHDGQVQEATVEVHAYPVFDQQGEVEYIIQYYTDITEQKEAKEALQRSEEKYRELVEGVDELITQVDLEGRFIFVNHMAKTIFGIEPEHCMGRSAFDFIHPDDRRETKKWFQGCVVRRLFSTTFENRQVNAETGKVYDMQWTCNFHYDDKGSLVNISSIASDISRLVKIKKEAEKSKRLQGQFLANMSHEIRTPLNAIIGMNNLALQTELSADCRRHLDVVRQNAGILLHTLNDILDYSKIEADQLVIKTCPFALQKLIDDERNTYSAECSERGNVFSTEIGIDVPQFVIGDHFRIKQVLNNLINNANKFTENGKIELMVTVQSSSGDDVILLFAIRDTGKGIPQDSQDDIFTRFQQVDGSLSRKHGGVGLGLAISKKIISLLHGDIWLKSEEGVGSTFYFTIPLIKTPKSSVPSLAKLSQKTEANHRKPLRILVVEDNAFNQDLLQTFLRQDKHSVHCAGNGLEALKILSEREFDVILMDVQMPILDGLESTRLIRLCESGLADGEREHAQLLRVLQEKRRGQHISIIGLTAHAFRRDRDNCLNIGMDGYITKPFLPEDLYREIEQLVPSPHAKKDESSTNTTSVNQDKIHGKKMVLDPNRVKNFMLEKYKLPLEKIDLLLKTISTSLVEELTTARDAIKQQDMETLCRSGHTLKGVLRNAGLDDLADIAFRLQKGETRSGDDTFENLGELLRQLTEGLQPMIEGEKIPPAT